MDFHQFFLDYLEVFLHLIKSKYFQSKGEFLLVIKVFRSLRDLFLFLEEADVCVRGVLGANLLFEVRPRRAGGLAVCTD